MKIQKRTVFELLLQVILFIMLLFPMFKREYDNAAVTEIYALLCQYFEVPNKTSYSYMDVLGLSTILSAVIIITVTACLVSIVIKITQINKNDVRICDKIAKTAVCTQLGSFIVFGILSTSTIQSTLNRWNVGFYLNSLIGKENSELVWELAGTNIVPYIEKMYGMPYYDYWAYLKLTPFYVGALAVMVISVLVYVKGTRTEI